MSVNIFDYNPIQEWNGKVINFGTGSSQNNFELTEIVTSAEGAQEATSLVDFDAYDLDTYKEINRIIRLFFSGKEFDVELTDWTISGDIYEIYTEISIAAIVSVGNYEILLDKRYSFRTSSEYPLYTPTGCYTGDFKKPRLSENTESSCVSQAALWLDRTYDTPFYSLKYIEGPRSISQSSGNLGGSDVTTMGMPYINLQWYEGALDPRCSNASYSTQPSCDSSPAQFIGCTDNSTGVELKARKMNNPTVWIDAADDAYDCNYLNIHPTYCYYSSSGTSWQSWTTSDYDCDRATSGQIYTSLYWLPKGTSTTTDTSSANWWPSTHTTNIVQSQVVYEGNSIYEYPSTWTHDQPPTNNSLTINYDELPDNGEKVPGRQTRIFWVGYELMENQEEHRTIINPSLDYIKGTMPVHTSVSSTYGKPLSVFGFTNNYGGMKIRFRAPQSTTAVGSRIYPTPDFYRIYRSNYYYYGSTSPTDYTNDIKHLVGEVEHIEDDAYMYFEEDIMKLRGEGLESQQTAYYWVTGVWSNLEMINKGLNATYYNGYFGDTTSPYTDNISWFDTASAGTTYTWYDVDYHGSGTTYSYKVTGYFRAKETGTYNFRVISDDASYMWLGASGTTYSTLQTTATIANSLISIPGLHVPTSVSNTINLIADTYYPILMYYGEYTVGEVLELFFTPPGGIEQQSGHGYYFKDDDDGTNNYNTDPQEREGQFSTNSAYSSFS